MITTAGFRDILELRRQKRDSLYDLQTSKPSILATRDRRLEVPERTLHDGTIHTQLDEAAVRSAARRLRDEGVRSIAVCFLFSYIEPKHEKMVRQILAEEAPEAFVSVSHEVAREFREYERFSTTVVNAYLGPIIKNYLQKLEPRLRKIGVEGAIHLTQSNGGVISSESAQRFPARTVLSGPAAGVMGALSIAQLTGLHNLITFDMGGTSTDVALIDGGQPQMAKDAVVHGYPLKLPMLDIHTVGAGGGSIANIDAGGMLNVGPRSAAADPGPICYGLGNEEPTVTDANVVLQVLNPHYLLNGRLKIDQTRAKNAIEKLGERLGLDVMTTAQGIISVVVANMAKAIRVISVERGYDPRDYVMLAFGGAGPIHAARLARALDMPRIVIPKYPGIMCALGLLLTDLRTSISQSRPQILSVEKVHGIEQSFRELHHQMATWFEDEAIPEDRRVTTRSLDMRYKGQGFELTIPCPEGLIDGSAIAALRAEFERAHRQAYGYIAENELIQITTMRLSAVGIVDKARFSSQPRTSQAVETAKSGLRQVWLPEMGGFSECVVYDRTKLEFGHCVSGPAIIEQMDSTTLVLPGQSATVDSYLNLVIEDHS